MTDQSAAAMSTVPPPARLEPDAIGVAQGTVIGMASPAPAASVGLTLDALAAATAVGVVMLIIAVVGIKITARAQVGMALAGYSILAGLSIAGLAAVFAPVRSQRPPELPGLRRISPLARYGRPINRPLPDELAGNACACAGMPAMISRSAGPGRTPIGAGEPPGPAQGPDRRTILRGVERAPFARRQPKYWENR